VGSRKWLPKVACRVTALTMAGGAKPAAMARSHRLKSRYWCPSRSVKVLPEPDTATTGECRQNPAIHETGTPLGITSEADCSQSRDRGMPAWNASVSSSRICSSRARRGGVMTDSMADPDTERLLEVCEDRGDAPLDEGTICG
jgi:hypothetical protein